MEGLATRLMDVLKVDGPEFEEIYEKDGDLTDIIARDPHTKEKAETKSEEKPSEAPATEKKADEWSIDSAINEAVAKDEKAASEAPSSDTPDKTE